MAGDERSSAELGILFFEVGSERSGTTLLRAMLDAHPLIAVPPENSFLVPLLRGREAWESSGTVAVDELVEFLARSRSFGEFGIVPADLRERWRAQVPATLPSALRDLYRVYAEQEGKPMVGDKTPHHVAVLDLVADHFPEARFLHIIRDGRDVAASLASAHFGPNSFPLATLKWRRDVLAGIAAGRRLGPDRYHEIYYEELIEDPRSVLGAICAFLAVPFDEAMLDYPERADQLLASMPFDAHLQSIRLPPHQTRNWHASLSPFQVELFDALTRDLLSALPYEPATDHDRLLVRAAAGATRRYKAGRHTIVTLRMRLGQTVGWRPADRAARGARRRSAGSA